MSETLALPARVAGPARRPRPRPPPGAVAGRAARRARRAGRVDAQRARPAGGRLRRAGVVAGRRRRRAEGCCRCCVLAATLVTVAPWVVYNAGRFEHTGAAVDERRHDAARRQLRPRRTTSTSAAGTSAASTRCPNRRHRRRLGALGRAPSRRRRLRPRPPRAGARSSWRPASAGSLDLYGLRSLVALDRGEEKAGWAVWAGIVCWWVLAIAAIFGWRRARPRRGHARTPLVAGRPAADGARDDHRCSTAPTGSGRRPSRPSCCSPPSAVVDAWERFRPGRVAHSPA